MKDFYKILGINNSASAAEIKSAYRKLAKKYHPDRNKGDTGAAERFKEVSEAYGVLSDPEKRRQFDLQSSWGNTRSFRTSFGDLFEPFGFNPFDRSSRPPPSQKRKKPQQTIPINITLEELMSGGKSTTLKIRVTKECTACGGVGGDYSEICKPCAGTGIIRRIQENHGSVVHITRPCELCAGRGNLISGICRCCNGTGKIQELNEWEVSISSRKKQ